jgi:hypothetical protein
MPQRYLRLVDNARKTVAIVMAICAAGLILCVGRDGDLQLTLGRDSGIWRWAIGACGIGIAACLVVTIALVIEYLARAPAPTSFTLRSLLFRSAVILLAVGGIGFWMGSAYGPEKGIGAMIGAFLLLAAVLERRPSRALLALLVLGIVAWGTQSAYQYASRNADQIVAAGGELKNRLAKGGEIEPGDPRVPEVLRNLGARRIWVDEQRVAVYVGDDVEFQIFRTPHPDTTCNPVWGVRGKGATKITDRLWTNQY